jgi:hypothetical protein
MPNNKDHPLSIMAWGQALHRGISMKNHLGRLGILAVAGLILAVIASGTAFATDWSKYSGVAETTYSGGSNPTMNQNAYGSKGPVSVNDRLFWDNTMHNNVGHSVTVYVGGVTAPPYTGGLYGNEYSTGISAGGTAYNNNHAATVAVAGSHSILNYHGYQDGQYYSVTGQDMSYT